VSADFIEHRPITKPGPAGGSNLQEVALALREAFATKGATWFRATVLDLDGDPVLVVEGWRERPEDEGPEPCLADLFPEGRS
jgi:hypothetical protein